MPSSPVHERDGARETCLERLVLEHIRSGSLVDVDKLHGRPIEKRDARGQPQRTQCRSVARETYLGVSGNANVTAEEPWALTADRQPHSLIVHAEKTQTEAGKAGTAGARVSCLTLTA